MASQYNISFLGAFLISVNFYLSIVLGMVMYVNEFEPKEKQKLAEIKKN